MKTRDELRREAEAVKGTEAEAEGLTPVRVKPSRRSIGTIYSLRFTREEMATLQRAAQERNMKLSEFIRGASLEEAARPGPSPRERAMKEARELALAAARVLEESSSSG